MSCDAFAVALCPILIKCDLALVRFASEWGVGEPNPSALASAAVDPARHERAPSEGGSGVRPHTRRAQCAFPPWRIRLLPNNDRADTRVNIAIIGAGPCTLSALERLLGNARALGDWGLWPFTWLAFPRRTGPALAHQPVTGAAHEHRGLRGDRVHGQHCGHGRAG